MMEVFWNNSSWCSSKIRKWHSHQYIRLLLQEISNSLSMNRHHLHHHLLWIFQCHLQLMFVFRLLSLITSSTHFQAINMKIQASTQIWSKRRSNERKGLRHLTLLHDPVRMRKNLPSSLRVSWALAHERAKSTGITPPEQYSWVS